MSRPSHPTLSSHQIYPTTAYASTSSSWPSPTPPPLAPAPAPPLPSIPRRRRKRKDADGTSHPRPRQTITDSDAVDKAIAQCTNPPDFEVVSCFPSADDKFPQHQWASFVWSSQRPELTQINKVNIYLYRAYSGELAQSWLNRDNDRFQAGMVTAQVNDTWWGEAGRQWNGSDIDYSFFWAITRSDQPPPQFPITPQATFNAVQTTYADFVVSSMSVSSASAAAASASAAAASASLSEFSRTETLTSDGQTQTVVVIGGSGRSTTQTLATIATLSSSTSLVAPSRSPGSVQSGNGSSDFPHWAIAVIVVLGFLAIVAGGIATWLIMRRLRQRRSAAGSRASTHSGTPILDRHGTANDVHAPLMAEAGIAGAAAGAAASHKHDSAGEPKVMNDGASTISRAHSESAPFSGADAAIMADAFRKALRKPEFPGAALEEGETPESQKERREAELLGAELAQEGRDLRSVGSSRDVRVQDASAEAARDDHSTIENAP